MLSSTSPISKSDAQIKASALQQPGGRRLCRLKCKQGQQPGRRRRHLRLPQRAVERNGAHHSDRAVSGASPPAKHNGRNGEVRDHAAV